ncbi:MAG TPA: hypothetical protein EYP78_04620 [Candidatus Omnitrophica bacterium]|nr:hypothetical protein [Candidatus Omnitrophota bacterium]
MMDMKMGLEVLVLDARYLIRWTEYSTQEKDNYPDATTPPTHVRGWKAFWSGFRPRGSTIYDSRFTDY